MVADWWLGEWAKDNTRRSLENEGEVVEYSEPFYGQPGSLDYIWIYASMMTLSALCLFIRGVVFTKYT